MKTKKDKQLIEQILNFSHYCKDNSTPQLSLKYDDFKMAWEYFRKFEEKSLPLPDQFNVERLTVKLMQSN